MHDLPRKMTAIKMSRFESKYLIFLRKQLNKIFFVPRNDLFSKLEKEMADTNSSIKYSKCCKNLSTSGWKFYIIEAHYKIFFVPLSDPFSKLEKKMTDTNSTINCSKYCKNSTTFGWKTYIIKAQYSYNGYNSTAEEIDKV